MKNKASINDKSIDSAGLPKDYMQAVAEIIWNGFDAKASEIEIRFEPNNIDTLNSIEILDNGEGIDYPTLGDTFGAFLDSRKRNSYQRSSYNRGKKGKGRFSFATFSGKATWHTVYKQGSQLLEYDITISKFDKDHYEDANHKVSTAKQTGTCVKLIDLFGITAYSFLSSEFLDFLGKEFGWFLFLNKENEFSIKINGTAITYDKLIGESDEHNIIIKNDNQKEHKFRVTYLRWNESIGDKYYFYFLNNDKRECAKRLTSYNNNATGFHHSIFIQSNYFDDFILREEDFDSELFGKNQNDIVFKALIKDLNEYVFQKQKEFIRRKGAEDLIINLEQKGVFPKFGKNKYDAERRNDLIEVVKELYCIQPKIFKGLKPEQESTFLGFLNLLLDTDERENILQIIEDIVKLKKEERDELTLVLKKTSFSKIIATVRIVENRFKVVELLKSLVFDLKKFTDERNHVQTTIEENYWLFGEQYHLASADKNFEHLLSNYLYIIDNVEGQQKINAYDKKRRPDIFMCRKRNVPDTVDNEYGIEENIMVELKRPSVTITKKEFRQIDDYLDFILRNDQFNSQLRRWKFYVISNTVDEYIEKQYEAFKDKGKRFLVQQAGKYEIYALTWDDLFRTFELKHAYLLEKLDFDKVAIEQELKAKGIVLSRDGSNEITEKIVELTKMAS